MFTKTHWSHLALSGVLLLMAGCEVSVQDRGTGPADAPPVHDTTDGTSGNRDGGSSGSQDGGDTSAPSDSTRECGDVGGGHHSGKPSDCTCDAGPSATPDGPLETTPDGGVPAPNDLGTEPPADSFEPRPDDATADVRDVVDVVEVALDGATHLPDAQDADGFSVDGAKDTLDAETPARRRYGYYSIPARGLSKIDLSTIEICDSCTLSIASYRGANTMTLISGSLESSGVTSYEPEKIIARGPQPGKTLSIINGDDLDIMVWLYVDQGGDSGVNPTSDADADVDAAVDAPQASKRRVALYFLGGETVDLSTLDICPSCQLYATVYSCSRAYETDVSFSGAVNIMFRRSVLNPSVDTHPTNDVLLSDALGPRTGALTVSNRTQFMTSGTLLPRPCALVVSLWTKPAGE